MFRSFRRLDLENDVKNQLEEQETDVSVLEKKRQRKTYVVYYLATKTQMVGAYA